MQLCTLYHIHPSACFLCPTETIVFIFYFYVFNLFFKKKSEIVHINEILQ